MTIMKAPIAASAMRFGHDPRAAEEAGAFFLCGENLASYAITTDLSPRSAALQLLAFGYIDRDDPRAVAASETGPRSRGVLEMTRTGNPSSYLGEGLAAIDSSALPLQTRIHLVALSGSARENRVDVEKAAVTLDEISRSAHKDGAAAEVAQSLAVMSANCTMAAVVRRREKSLDRESGNDRTQTRVAAERENTSQR